MAQLQKPLLSSSPDTVTAKFSKEAAGSALSASEGAADLTPAIKAAQVRVCVCVCDSILSCSAERQPAFVKLSLFGR